MAGRRKRKLTKRSCLRCDRDFMSDGIHNRVCPNCRDSNKNFADMYPLDGVYYGRGIYKRKKDRSD